MKILTTIWNWIVRLFSPQQVKKGIQIRKSSNKKVLFNWKAHRASKNANCRYASTKGFAIS